MYISSSVQFSRSVMSDSLQPHELQHVRPPRVYSNSCPLSRWSHPTISSSVVHFSSCLQSFPASGSFPMSQLFASLQHQTLLPSPVTSATGYFLFWLRLFILSGVISPLFSSSILGTYQPEEFIIQCHIFDFSVHGVFKARMLKWFAIPFSSGPHFVKTLHPDSSVFCGPTRHSS